MDLPIRVVVLGAGDRGRTYASYALAYPERVKVVGVADIDPVAREAMAKAHNIPPEMQWGDWSEAIAANPECDVMTITMPDAVHLEPALAALELGHHLLLEKPMARTWEECETLARKVRTSPNSPLVIVGHVLRYTTYFKKIKALLDAKVVGDVVSIRHLEPVGYMHAAHSFCRGNWGNTERATPMILQKCCHDFDQFVWWLGRKCTGVSSFGGLAHFNAAHRPEGAARCVDCPAEIERKCPYSAKKIYLERQDYRYPFVDKSDAGMEKLICESPYGRCVYACDNDAVDHQIVNLQFEGGLTVAHQMESYTYTGARETRIFCTRGEILGDGRTLTIRHFDTRKVELWDSILEAGAPAGGSHGGGDWGLMDELVNQLTSGDPVTYLDIFEASLESHRIAFAAEASRKAFGDLKLADESPNVFEKNHG